MKSVNNTFKFAVIIGLLISVACTQKSSLLGQLGSGSNGAASTATAASCSFNGQTMTSGGPSLPGYPSPTVPFGQTCQSQPVTCSNGQLSPNNLFGFCTPLTSVNPSPITSLPTLPSMTNVQLTMNGNSATITFDSVDNAADYRVYTLPANNNIKQNSDGSITIPNAIYRCAGTYQTPSVSVEVDNSSYNSGTTTHVTTSVNGYTRSMAEATLGYVYTTPNAAPNLIPVYAVGNPAVYGDGNGFWNMQATREKKYIASQSDYLAAVASGWRDDGIAFYVPATASASTRPVFYNPVLDGGDTSEYGARYYLNQGNELTYRTSNNASLTFTTAFNVLASPTAGARPLMRVFYWVYAGHAHDELAVGNANFNRIRNQGLNNPAPTLHFSGITSSTTLVVEALDRGCPYQGFLSYQALPGGPTDQGIAPGGYHEPYVTLANLQSASPTGEVYVNGQFDNISGTPKAIARAYISASPQAREPMDWISTPASFTETLSTPDCLTAGVTIGAGNCYTYHEQGTTYDYTFYDPEDHVNGVVNNRWVVGSVLGELLLTFADNSSDTNGKFRMTVKTQKGSIASSTFLHATMEVNSVTSNRRYPQMIISDQNIPVQNNLPNGHALVLQTKGDNFGAVQLEVCDHQFWDVNNQCPRFILRPKYDSSGNISGINPLQEADGYMTAVDQSVRYDLYESNSRAYIFINNKPYACANLTNNSGCAGFVDFNNDPGIGCTAPANTAVTVTYGDALYHTGADTDFNSTNAGWMEGGFINRHQQYDTKRHFDNLGFSSGVAAPTWNETEFPCSSQLTMDTSDPGP